MSIWGEARDAYKREKEYQAKLAPEKEKLASFGKDRGGPDDGEFWHQNATVASIQDNEPRLWRKHRKQVPGGN